MLIKKTATSNDYELILTIWELSVKATHHFLSSEDQAFYKMQIPKFLDAVELSLWYNGNQVVGFSGGNAQELEMLFLDPKYIGKGYGNWILTWLIEHKNIRYIDVNKQNKNAKEFYLKHGFEVASESQTDGFGKPYPILHLKR
ncbi:MULTISPECIES: GNAT family N-acetyltransferase [Vagococcus]|uniref:Acetyltransferase, GNAT family n=1 Tax=Vagococcus fluvialis bH819 TaxID=1255619 RepID=A0A1X6WKR5_9ENTE|nr:MULTISPECIES: GNAT family N-acetyltransferase [Vagococcus]SLM84832.1 acetyltransferase, GNAT family [Vagococcus fluvialis bH819]HCM89139.1 GNAT family N-acetyltransferase [Vagococcus sp.]